jgi:hypothetical protein
MTTATADHHLEGHSDTPAPHISVAWLIAAAAAASAVADSLTSNGRCLQPLRGYNYSMARHRPALLPPVGTGTSQEPVHTSDFATVPFNCAVPHSEESRGIDVCL